MIKPSSDIIAVKEHLESARLILLYKAGNQVEAFKIAKSSNPNLAAAFLTETAEPLRNGLTIKSQIRRVKLLTQATEILRLSNSSGYSEVVEAVAWLTAEISQTRQRGLMLRRLYLNLMYGSICIILAGLTLLLFYA